ncbi:Abi family protein [Arcanobacterium ihumii]|uniref:Abi family protein n=1 Tax=Arcanobacterium ihumii TaxID=2138162 RepID=UPI000F534169|nr:Abi family protein [Arcanobacterium ihumii]
MLESASELECFLEKTAYYRFSGYFREFQVDPRHGENEFVQGTTLNELAELIELDARLRVKLLEALTIIELRARTAFSHQAGRVLGEKAFYLNPEYYLNVPGKVDGLIQKIERDLKRSMLPTINRYKVGDDLSRIPIWVAIETMTFGTLAKTSTYLKEKEVISAAASSLNIATTGFSDSLHAFSALRNRCAHHSQLWNRSFDIAFKVLPKEKKGAPKFSHPGSYAAIIVTGRWMKRMGYGSSWFESVVELLSENRTFEKGILEPSMK